VVVLTPVSDMYRSVSQKQQDLKSTKLELGLSGHLCYSKYAANAELELHFMMICVLIIVINSSENMIYQSRLWI